MLSYIFSAYISRQGTEALSQTVSVSRRGSVKKRNTGMQMWGLVPHLPSTVLCPCLPVGAWFEREHRQQVQNTSVQLSLASELRVQASLSEQLQHSGSCGSGNAAQCESRCWSLEPKMLERMGLSVLVLTPIGYIKPHLCHVTPEHGHILIIIHMILQSQA